MTNAFSVDLEEWYHICGLDNLSGRIEPKYKIRIIDNTARILDLLQSKNVKATFFVLGALAEKFPGLIKEIDRRGHEIASHSFNHQQIHQQTKEQFAEDLKKSIRILNAITKKDVLGFRAPDFSITKDSLWALDVLVDCGLKYDCSIFPIRHPRYGMPDAERFIHKVKRELIEFPPSTIRFLGYNIAVAGGAYFRVIPYGFIKRAINSLNARGIPANMYFHPWELDPEQPKLMMPWHRRFAHYTNLRNTKRRLERLLEDFQFSTIREVLGIGK
jgi:polysaccharide deacetylase family protein (PEP-CTERM system associated)